MVNKNATLYIESNYQNSAPNILFNTISSKFSITDPKKVIIYNKTNACLSFENTSTFNINCEKIDYWLNSPQLISSSVIENNPLYSWYKSNEENISISATVTSSKTTVTSSNLTEAEQEALPQLSLLTFQTAKTLRFMEAGNLVLKNEPSIIEFQRPLISTNPLILGRKEKTITMTVVDSRAVSTDWYLYAYIDEPLSTSDNEHTLTDSLIFVDKNNEIKTLEKTPTLMYTGTKNDGDTKTTTILWEENKGILFKVIEPLYNGKIYKTTINWILTNEKIERKLILKAENNYFKKI